MQFRRLVDTSALLRSTRSRTAKIAALARLLQESPADRVPLVVAYLSGELPQGKVGAGHVLVHSIEVAPAADSTLTIGEVDAALASIAGLAGPGSRTERRRILSDLFGVATAPEQAFLRGLLLGELRQGASSGVMEEAIAEATSLSVGAVRRASMLGGDLGRVGRRALEGDGEALSGLRLCVFTPVQPMLAQTAPDVAAALARTGPAAVEYKLDGARIQIHRRGDVVRVYTRSLRDITGWTPEVVEAVSTLDFDAAILDGEAIALDEAGRPRPFQVTMSRLGRTVDIDRLRVEVPLVPFFFDCIHLDGADLIDVPARDRAAALAKVVPGDRLVPRVVTADSVVAEAALAAALDAGHEGVVVKALDGLYAAGRRGAAWVKVKPVHSLDLVVLAAEWGSGRRRGWLSNLHLGARDAGSGQFVMLGKTFKGLTDELLAWQTDRLLQMEIRREGRVVYVRPEQVVEIAFDGVQRSTRYPGGVALRFARVRGYREDKTADEADTIQTVRGFLGG